MHPQLIEIVETMLDFVKQFHVRGQLAPHAACMNTDGTVLGRAFTIKDDSVHLPVERGLQEFERQFREEAQAGQIVGSAIFFHGVVTPAELRPALTEDEANAIVVALEHMSGESVHLVLPYRGTGESIEYASPQVLFKPNSVFPAASVPAGKPWWKFW